MNPLWFVVGAIGGFMLAQLTIILLETEWRPRRCQRGKPCGCKTVKNGFGIYLYCDDSPAKDGKPSEVDTRSFDERVKALTDSSKGRWDGCPPSDEYIRQLRGKDNAAKDGKPSE